MIHFIRPCLALCFLSFSAIAAERPSIGYGGPRIQLHPIMAPFHTANGIRYEALTLRVVLPEAAANDESSRSQQIQRSACYTIPVLHEELLIHLQKMKLSPQDLTGRRREVLSNELLNVAINAFGPSLYAGVEFVDFNSAALNPISRTLSAQCR